MLNLIAKFKPTGISKDVTQVGHYIVLWYVSAVVAVTSSRSVLSTIRLPFCLSACQFCIATILNYIIIRWWLPWQTKGSYKPALRVLAHDTPERAVVRSIALTYTMGFIFTNIALSRCNASFTETVKSAEPISSLTLAQLMRGEDAVSSIEWMTVVPIAVGVGFASYSDASFHVIGFVMAVLSNFMFSLRGLHSKHLRRLCGSPAGLDDLHLFYRISSFGLTIVLPLALIFEGRALFRLAFTGPLIKGVTESVTIDTSNSSDVHGSSASSPHMQEGSLRPSHLIAVALLNGVCYCAYNQASFLVLSRVTFMTHATLNVMRRVVIIAVTSWWFATPMTRLNCLGIFLAISGFAVFLYIKIERGRLLPH